MSDRWDTSFESEGAEFLVLGSLLVRGIVAYKAYGRTPNYDIAATGFARTPEVDPNRVAHISVKSRFWTNASGSVLKNLNFHFLVVVRLNRGDKHYRVKPNIDGMAGPEFYVIPVRALKTLCAPRKGGGYRIGRPVNYSQYKDKWDLIGDFLNGKPV